MRPNIFPCASESFAFSFVWTLCFYNPFPIILWAFGNFFLFFYWIYIEVLLKPAVYFFSVMGLKYVPIHLFILCSDFCHMLMQLNNVLMASEFCIVLINSFSNPILFLNIPGFLLIPLWFHSQKNIFKCLVFLIWHYEWGIALILSQVSMKLSQNFVLVCVFFTYL